MTLQTILSAQASPEIPINENFAVLGALAVYGRDATTTAGLTWGFLAGRWGGFAVTAGTLTLANAATNYVVVLRSTGAISVSSTITNWNDTAAYARVYQLTTAGDVVTATQDHRVAGSGVFGSGGSAPSGPTQVPNLQTGTTYTYVTADSTRLVSHSNAAAIAGTLPQAGVSFPDGWFTDVQNRGAGTLTITPTTSTIDGAATIVLTTGQGVRIASNGVNYFTQRGAAAGSGGGLTHFTEAIDTAAPNATVPVVSLTATNAATNVDVALRPKGSGSFSLQVADNTTAGGNKRGTRAVDLQTVRNNANQVASGTSSLVSGINNRASGANSVAIGSSNSAQSSQSVAIGAFNDAQGANDVAIGSSNTLSGGGSGTAIGDGNIVSALFGQTFGRGCTASGQEATAIGANCTASGINSLALGNQSSTFAVTGRSAFSSGRESSRGDTQIGALTMWNNTTNATPARLSSTGGAAATTNQLTMSTHAVFMVKGKVVAYERDTGDSKAWVFDAALKRTGAGVVSMIAASTPTVVAENAGATTWSVAVTADDTLKCINVSGTGQAAKTIRWVCSLDSIEMLD